MKKYSLIKKETIDELFGEYKEFFEVAGDVSFGIRLIKNAASKIIENKFKKFINEIEFFSQQEIIDFIDEIKNDENKKTIFIDSINKSINLDDSLQIYILASLVKSFKEKGDFSYSERKLYYNINQLTEDDFSIFYCFYKKYILKNKEKNSFAITRELKNSNLVETVIKVFVSFNILVDETTNGGMGATQAIFRISLTNYSEQLFNILDIYFKKLDKEDSFCKKYLEIDENYGTFTELNEKFN